MPEDTLIMAQIYSAMRMEEYFPEPDRFNPDRFLTKDGQPDKVNISRTF